MVIVASVVVIAVSAAALCCVFLPKKTEETRTAVLYLHIYDGTVTELEVNSSEGVILPDAGTRDGYTFAGWFVNENSTVSADEAYFDSYDYGKNLDLYQKWTINDPVTVSFKSNDGTGVAPIVLPRGASIDIIPATEKDEYYFLGWYYDVTLTKVYIAGETIASDTVFYAKWVPKNTDGDTVTLQFISDGGTAVPDTEIETGSSFSLPLIYKTGCDFAGWYADKDYIYQVTENTVFVEPVILYAKWIENRTLHTVIFDSCGGTGADDMTFMHNLFVDSSDLPIPSYGDSVFSGWYYDANLTESIGEGFRVSKDTTLYAKYSGGGEPARTYYVWYDYMYRTAGGVEATDSRSVEEGGFAPEIKPTRDGYAFLGWYADDLYTSEYDFSSAVTANFTVYAKWETAPALSDGVFRYELSGDGTYYILAEELNETEKKVVIPDMYDGKPIKEIASEVFKGRLITSLTIGNNIASIGSYAFSEALSCAVVLPESVTAVGTYAFYKSALPALEIKGAAIMEQGAFYGCAALKNVTADNMKSVAVDSFYGCTELYSVSMANVSLIDRNAFYGCTALKNCSFAALAEIRESAFYGCAALSAFDFPSGLTVIGTYAFTASGIKSVDTDNVVSAAGAFCGCPSLISVTLGGNFKDRFITVFGNCENIADISVSTDNAVYSARNGNLYSKDLKEFIYYAGGNAAESFTLPSTVTSVGGYMAFYSAKNLKEILVAEGNTAFKSVGGNLYSADGKTMYAYAASQTAEAFTTPDTVTSIQSGCFSFAPLVSITLSQNVAHAEFYAFYGMDTLTSIIIKNSALTLDGTAIGECPNVTVR